MDLFDPVAAGKALGEQYLALVVFGERGLGRLAIELEGDHKIGTELTRKATGRDNGITTVGALGNRRGIVANKLSAARGAYVGTVEGGDVRCTLLRIRGIDCCSLGFLLSRLLLVCVALLDVGQRELRVAMVADKQRLRAVIA